MNLSLDKVFSNSHYFPILLQPDPAATSENSILVIHSDKLYHNSMVSGLLEVRVESPSFLTIPIPEIAITE